MTILNFEVKTYQVLLGKTIGVGFTNLNYAAATIDCRGAGGEQLLIVFAATQAQADVGGNFTDLTRKRGGVVAAMSSFPAYIDLLRNEGPVFAQVDSGSPNTLNLLKTGAEPVADIGK
jgi:hypothetical protein